MTDGRLPTPGCLDAETLAAFMDGRLEPRGRTAVEVHLAECDDCYEVWMEAQQVSTEVAGRVSTAPTVRYRRWAIVASIAATLAMGIAIGRGWPTRPRGLLYELAAATPGRPTEGRLVGFPWDALPDRSRAATRPEVSPEVTIAVARLKQALEKERSFDTLRANGAGELVLGNVDAAISSFREALALRSEPGALSDLSAALLARGAATGRPVDVMEAYEVARQALETQRDFPEGIFNSAVALERMGQRAQAIEAWEHFLRLDSKSEWAQEARRRLETLRKSGDAFDRDPARRTILETKIPAWAVGVTNGTSDDHLLAEAAAMAASADAGSPDQYTSDVVLSIQAAADKLKLAGAINDYRLGLQAGAARDHAQADAMFSRAESSLAKLNSPLRYSAALGKAAALYSLQRGVEAAGLLTGITPGIPDRYLRIRGRALWLSGIISMAAGQQTTGLDAYEQSVTAYSASGETGNAAFVSGLMAEGYLLIGDLPRSWQFRMQAIKTAPRGSSMLAAALAARSQGWHQLAAYFQDAAVAASRATGDTRGIVDALRERSLSYAAASRITEARRTLQDAALLANRGVGPDWVRLRAELDLATARIADPDSLPEALAAADRALAFFRDGGILVRLPTAFLAKATVLEALRRTDDARATLTEGLAIYQEQRRRLPRGAMSSSLGDSARELVDRVVRLAIDAKEPTAAFAVLDENRSGHGGSAALRQPLTPEMVGSALPPRTSVLSFAVLERETLVWGISRSRSAFKRVGVPRAHLDDLVTRAAANADRSAASELYRLLIEPISEVVETEGVSFVIPDGPLVRLPFALLRDRSGRYLVETQAVALAPSAEWLLRSQPRAAESLKVRSIGAFGNPAFDRVLLPMLSNLPASESEAASVVESYARRSVKTGTSATRQAFEASLRADDVVHFAGHALVDVLDPEASFLALAGTGPSGTLTAAAVNALRGVRAQVVVLAACQSAGGPISRSEGALGLAQAFLHTGVRSVVAALTDIGDQSSQELFKVFHDQFAKSGDAIRALQKAQQVLLQDADGKPSDWASVVVFGGLESFAARESL